jgi:alkylated DNA nucleotide flippase Atl1
MSGAANTAGDIANSAGSAAGRTAGTVGATTQVGASTSAHLGAGSHGVVNIPGLSMSASATNSTQGSVITSDKKNVKLDSGTEMVLRVNQ